MAPIVSEEFTPWGHDMDLLFFTRLSSTKSFWHGSEDPSAKKSTFDKGTKHGPKDFSKVEGAKTNTPPKTDTLKSCTIKMLTLWTSSSLTILDNLPMKLWILITFAYENHRNYTLVHWNRLSMASKRKFSFFNSIVVRVLNAWSQCYSTLYLTLHDIGNSHKLIIWGNGKKED